MGDVVKEMRDQTPDRFFGFPVFLATYMAKPAMDLGITIKTDLFFAFSGVRQCKIFPKIVKPMKFSPNHVPISRVLRFMGCYLHLHQF
jgi:hypothetical protein